MMLPRWKDVVPAISMGRVMRRAEPATVRAAISATNTIFRVEIFCLCSIFVASLKLDGLIIAKSGIKYSAKYGLKNRTRIAVQKRSAFLYKLTEFQKCPVQFLEIMIQC